MIRTQRLGRTAPSLSRRSLSQYASLCAQATRNDAASRVHEDQLDALRVGVKANIVTHEPQIKTSTAASAILSGYRSPFDATVVQLLKGRNVSFTSEDIGQGMDEFGMGSHSQYGHDGPVKSIYSRNGVALSPGGSSGGSAVAVAKGDRDVALGTDTGGSVRLPAAYLGILGFKPSYGRISRWGVIQYANSLDTVGILAQSMDNLRATFDAVDKYDKKDPTSLPQRVRDGIEKAQKTDREVLRIGVPIEYNIAELSPIVRKTYLATLETLRKAGHSLHPVSLPSTRSALSAYYVLAPAEASSNLAKYDGIRYGQRTKASDASPNNDPPLPLYAQTRGEGFGDEVKRRILLGAYTLSSAAMDNYFIQAQRVRRLVQRDFDAVFAQKNPLLDSNPKASDDGKVDLLLTPTAPTLPPTVTELASQALLEGYTNDVFTVPASLAGLPAISIPARIAKEETEKLGSEDVRAAGMQLIGQFGVDQLVLSAAETIIRHVAAT